MKCPNCDTYNPDNAKFCRTCGINLQDNDIFEKEEENIAKALQIPKVMAVHLTGCHVAFVWWSYL